jgi:hypothetical protein
LKAGLYNAAMSTGFAILPAMFVGWFVSSLVPAKAFGTHHAAYVAVKAAVAGAATAVTAVLVLLLTKRFSV